MSKLHQLFYVSTRKESCGPEEIDKILKSAIKNNSHQDITGVLIHSEGKFIQYLEGAKEKLEAIYNIIKLDNRHENVILLGSFSLENRLFPSWQMGFKDITKNSYAFNTKASDQDAEVFNNILSGKMKTDIFLTNFIRKVSTIV